MEKEELEQLKLQAENFEATPKTILTIKTMPKLEVVEDKGVTINDGYAFEVNGALPEIADGIAKLAFEMPKNGWAAYPSSQVLLRVRREPFRPLQLD